MPWLGRLVVNRSRVIGVLALGIIDLVKLLQYSGEVGLAVRQVPAHDARGLGQRGNMFQPEPAPVLSPAAAPAAKSPGCVPPPWQGAVRPGDRRWRGENWTQRRGAPARSSMYPRCCSPGTSDEATRKEAYIGKMECSQPTSVNDTTASYCGLPPIEISGTLLERDH